MAKDDLKVATKERVRIVEHGPGKDRAVDPPDRVVFDEEVWFVGDRQVTDPAEIAKLEEAAERQKGR